MAVDRRATETGEDEFLAVLARERQAYGLPPRLSDLASRFVDGALQLLFPHFAAEVGSRAADVRDEYAGLRDILDEALHVPGRAPPDHDAVVDRFFADLPAIRETLLADARAIDAGDPASLGVDEVILAYPGFLATAVHRIAHALYASGVAIFPRLLAEHAHRATGIDIHPGATIGPSFAIDHGTGIVIGETAVIGVRVRLYQGVTLGATSVAKRKQGTKRHPTVEDDVVIYANATILGGDTRIGRGSRIGGNVWLTSSVPPYSVVTPTAKIDRRSGSAAADDLMEFNI